MTFLDELAERLINSHGADLKDCAVILPSKRSSLYLKKALSRKIKGTFWAPLTLNFTDLISRYASDDLMDSTSLSFELYEAHKELAGQHAESFDQFYKWGEILLSDFNQIDLYQLEASEVFKDLQNIQELESWSMETHTELQKKYLSFWKGLAPLYYTFNKHLQSKGLTYSGSAYKRVAEQLRESGVTESEFNAIYFCGLNALSPCEIDIINSFKKSMKTEVIWDVDQHYISNPNHEAGHFYRSIIRHNSNLKADNIPDNLDSTDTTITIYESSSTISQAKIAAQILEERPQNNNPESFAIILPDPSMLLPLVHEMPSAVNSANVTMGFPINKTEIFSLLTHVINFQENSKKYETQRKNIFIHHKPFQRFIKHPVLRYLFGEELDRMDYKIRKENKVFIQESDLSDLSIYRSIPTLFQTWTNLSNQPVESLLALIDFLEPRLGEDSGRNKINLQSISQLREVLTKLGQTFCRYPYVEKMSTFKRVFNNICNNHELAFYGEPLSGIQIMGLLESRALDFEELIILSVNEGILPRGRQDNSILPFDLKRHHKLPASKEKDAVLSNHFFRLLQRAKNIHLVYSPLTDRFGSGEKSRFLLQLEEELHKVKISSKKFKTFLAKKPKQDAVRKNAEYIKLLENYFTNNGLSISGINRFITCPLDFYYTYICGIRDDDQVQEEIEDSSMGTIVHGVLEDIYKPFIDQELRAAFLRKSLERVEDLTEQKFKTLLNQKNLYGINYLSKEMAILQIEKVLRADIEDLENGEEIKLLGVELDFSEKLKYNWNGNTIDIKLTGKIDRVDTKNGIVRLIDYKTGTFDNKKLKSLDLNDSFQNASNLELQLAFYAFVYGRSHPNKTITSWIVALKGNKKLYNQGSVKNLPYFGNDFHQAFDSFLKSIIDEMTNEEIDLIHDESSKYCQICD